VVAHRRRVAGAGARVMMPAWLRRRSLPPRRSRTPRCALPSRRTTRG
jgi:hypothetical protein